MFEWCTQNLRRNGSISRGTSHATTTERYQYTTSVDINNTRYKKEKEKGHSHSFRITCDMCAVSLLQSKEERYIKAMNNNNNDNNNLASTIPNVSCLYIRIASYLYYV